ncbi:MAG: TatD family hydrolase [Spirochaetaceae bacterium]|jgi:TatD DNase family protein|nr:TatD family hydrolase [Spirochaetaceae bacterium]
MASDTHGHPYYLYREDARCEQERMRLGIRCAASSFNEDEFIFNEMTAHQEGAPFMALCFGVHPQLPAHQRHDIERACSFLETLAKEKRIAAIGETGFDLFSDAYRAHEQTQDAIFEHHLGIALRYNLPVVLHIRRAMHKVFLFNKQLKRLAAVVFHSYSGSLDEARSVLRRGINGYFSFGSAIMMNHKNAMQCCAALDAERLLFETDAPYQPLYGKKFSVWQDIFQVINAASALRREAGSTLTEKNELEYITDKNFDLVFGGACWGKVRVQKNQSEEWGAKESK